VTPELWTTEFDKPTKRTKRTRSLPISSTIRQNHCTMHVTHSRTGRCSTLYQSRSFHRDEPCSRIQPASHTSYGLRGERSLMTWDLNAVTEISMLACTIPKTWLSLPICCQVKATNSAEQDMRLCNIRETTTLSSCHIVFIHLLYCTFSFPYNEWHSTYI